MKTRMAVFLLMYGGVLLALGLVTHSLSPATQRISLIAGAAGGALCLLWGTLGLLGFRRRIWAILTLAVVCFALLSQTVTLWMDGSATTAVAAIVTLMFLISASMIMYVTSAGESQS